MGERLDVRETRAYLRFAELPGDEIGETARQGMHVCLSRLKLMRQAIAFHLRRMATARPGRAVPSKSREAGSGVGVAVTLTA
jgi:hypothetical protein